MVVISLPAGAVVADIVTGLSGEQIVEQAEANLVYRAHVAPNDPDFSSYWALNNVGQTGGKPGVDINALDAWERSTGDASVVIGVIDSGIDYNHPDLQFNVWRNPGEIAGNGLDDDGNGWADDLYGIDTVNDDSDPMDDEGHGTHIAGTIGARGDNGRGGVGVMWRASIVSCKFLDANGVGTLDGALECLDYFSALKSAGVNVVATNNSWGGGGFSSLLQARIAEHRNQGMLFVASAGNDGFDTDRIAHYPSGYDLVNVISVAASNSLGDKAGFSNYGLESVDLAAPGVAIPSTYPGGRWRHESGTSMAAAHVTGVLGLLKSNDPSLSMSALRAEVLNSVARESSLEPLVASGGRLRAMLPIIDNDNDGMHDNWELRFGLDPTNPADGALDSDSDGLSNLGEFQAGSNPQRSDTDDDGLSDGDEVNVYGTDPLAADSDGDGLEDGEEVQTFGTNPASADSDGDSLTDDKEINTYGTDPTRADSDNDGMPDGYEVEYDFDPLSPGDAQADADGDGLSNLQEVSTGTDPRAVDTDDDGLTDAEELNVHGTDPLNDDTDGDGIADGWEIRYGFDPRDAGDAALDADNDGFSNLTEYRSRSNPLNGLSTPQLQPWSAFQGSARRDGFVPLHTDVGNFVPRWSRTEELGNELAVGDFTLYYSINGFNTAVTAIDMRDGKRLWRNEEEQYVSTIMSPILSDDRLLVSRYSRYGLNHSIRVFDTESGTLLDQLPAQSTPEYEQLVATDETAYFVDGNNVSARDVASGGLLWSTPAPAIEEARRTVLAANEGYVVHQGDDVTQVLDGATGALLHTVPAPVCTSQSYVGLALDGDEAFYIANGCAARLDLASGTIVWHVDVANRGQTVPALDGAHFYIAGDAGLAALSRLDGSIVWSDTSQRAFIDTNIVVTLDHLFVAGSQGTVAIDLTTQEVTRIEEKRGRLLITDHGALVISDSIRRQDGATVIDLEGDSDADGMPNWWERYYRLDHVDPADATADSDGDSLDNLAEFEAGTNPNRRDTDGDSLDDAFELAQSGTDPTNADSDDDGLNDGLELNVYATDPLSEDTDRDGVSDGKEVFEFGTDPTDPASRPVVISDYFESFENGVPREWTTPAQGGSAWTQDNRESTNGAFSLKAGVRTGNSPSSLEWSGLFLAGDLMVDLRKFTQCCGNLKIILDDDETLAQVQNGDWYTYIFSLPFGQHSIRFEFDGTEGGEPEGEGAWIDNVRFQVPDPLGSGLDNLLISSRDLLVEVTPDGSMARSAFDLEMSAPFTVAIPDNHKLYFSQANTLYRFDPQTGETMGWEWHGRSGFVAALGRRIYATNRDAPHGLVVFDEEGSVLATGMSGTQYTQLDTGPDGTLFALRRSGWAVDQIDGTSLEVIASSTLDTGVIWMAIGESGHIYATDREARIRKYTDSGTLLAIVDSPLSGGLGRIVAIDGGGLIAEDGEGNLVELDENLVPQRFATISTAVDAPRLIASIRRSGADLDADGLPDWWEYVHRLSPEDASDAAADADGDGLSNSDEFELGTDPGLKDTDRDGLSDSEEVSEFGTNPRSADADNDRLLDSVEIRDAMTDPHSADTDADGLEDGFEFFVLGTSPLSEDTDADRMPDLWEYENALNPLNAADAGRDRDGDGLSNLREFQNGTLVSVADSDSDGLGDAEEVDTFGTGPIVRDSDADGIGDGWEVRYGLDPLGGGDANADPDRDGYSSIDEFRADTDPTSILSRPGLVSWSTHQGDPAHRGFVPLRIVPSQFVELWSNTPLDDQDAYELNNAAAAAGTVWVSAGWPNTYQGLVAINAITGERLWHHEFEPTLNLSPPAFADNRLYLQSSNFSTGNLWALHADTGQTLFRQQARFRHVNSLGPTPFEGDVIVSRGDGGLESFSGSTTSPNWFAQLYSYEGSTPAVDETSVYDYDGVRVAVFDRLDGSPGTSIFDLEVRSSNSSTLTSPILDRYGDVLVADARVIKAFDLDREVVAWRFVAASTDPLPQPALVGDELIVADDLELVALSAHTGEEQWRVPIPEQASYPVVATLDHALISSSSSTYAVRLGTGEIDWSYPRGGALSIGPEGILYIVGEDRQVSAIMSNLDSDNDGMPDGWERAWGLDEGNGIDADEDNDLDGLSNRAEYGIGSKPGQRDSDGDGLQDGEEVNDYGTSPVRPDSEGDGMLDGWEVQFGLDPNAADADGDLDGDGATNLEEFAADTDPTNPNSAPGISAPTPSPNPSPGPNSPSGGGGGGAIGPLGLFLLLVLRVAIRRNRIGKAGGTRAALMTVARRVVQP